MELPLFVFVVVLLCVVGILLYILYQKKSSNHTSDSQSIALMTRWMEQMQQRLDRNADVLERKIAGARAVFETVSIFVDRYGKCFFARFCRQKRDV